MLDYEMPMLRRDRAAGSCSTSTHWPWIGERTRQLDGAHVALLAEVVNPVACKVGPTMAVDERSRCARGSIRCGSRAAYPDRPDGRRRGCRPATAARGGRSRGRAPGDLAGRSHARQHSDHRLRVARRDPETIVREIRAFQVGGAAAGGVAGGYT